MDKTTTLDQIREAAKAIVAAQGPDFRYRVQGSETRCAYVPATDERYPYGPEDVTEITRTTGCLVGRIADELDVMTDGLAGTTLPIGSAIYHGFWDAVIEDRASEYLSLLQVRQDGGATWAEALKTAESGVAR